MNDGDEDEIDELREQTRGTDRISADAGDGEHGGEEVGEQIEERTEEETGGGQRQKPDKVEEKEQDEGGARNLPAPSEEFERAFKERANRTGSGLDPRTVSARDPALSALLLALQDIDELDEVGGTISDALGSPEPPEYDRDSVVRLAVAYALLETAPKYFDVLAERV